MKLTETILDKYQCNGAYLSSAEHDEITKQILENQNIIERLKGWQDSLDDFQPHSSTWSESHIHHKIDEILGRCEK